MTWTTRPTFFAATPVAFFFSVLLQDLPDLRWDYQQTTFERGVSLRGHRGVPRRGLQDCPRAGFCRTGGWHTPCFSTA